jgi:hypothetical protein
MPVFRKSVIIIWGNFYYFTISYDCWDKTGDVLNINLVRQQLNTGEKQIPETSCPSNIS